jgi:sterol desaturase/sphingolipid hydroxylase (fatty acid hydroxylase superfamily)
MVTKNRKKDWVMLDLNWITSYLNGVFLSLSSDVMNPGSFFSFWPLFAAFVLAFAIIFFRLRSKMPGKNVPLMRVLKLMFPKDVFLHQSAKTDYVVYLINNGFLFFITLSVLITPAIFAEAILQIINYGGLGELSETASWTKRFLFTAVIVLAWDFGATYAHYLKHKVPFLWEFHKVHHSAEVMTPVTAMRRHPIDTLLGALVSTISMGLVIALWHFVFGGSVAPITIFGTWAGIYLWRLLGYNLRHSHIWISYGNFWNRIFISPAQHQIHHSIEAKHYDTNFGHIFSFWDAMFGSLYLPQKEERVKFGIEQSEMDQFKTLSGIYFTPFVKAFSQLSRPLRALRRNLNT